MKKSIFIAPLVAALCFFGCSKENNSGGPKRVGRSYIPPAAAEVVNSPDFKLEHTTKNGTRCFVSPVTEEIARSLDAESRDSHFLVKGDKPFFLVPIRDGKIIDLTSGEATEAAEFASQRSKK